MENERKLWFIPYLSAKGKDLKKLISLVCISIKFFFTKMASGPVSFFWFVHFLSLTINIEPRSCWHSIHDVAGCAHEKSSILLTDTADIDVAHYQTSWRDVTSNTRPARKVPWRNDVLICYHYQATLIAWISHTATFIVR